MSEAWIRRVFLFLAVVTFAIVFVLDVFNPSAIRHDVGWTALGLAFLAAAFAV